LVSAKDKVTECTGCCWMLVIAEQGGHGRDGRQRGTQREIRSTSKTHQTRYTDRIRR